MAVIFSCGIFSLRLPPPPFHHLNSYALLPSFISKFCTAFLCPFLSPLWIVAFCASSFPVFLLLRNISNYFFRIWIFFVASVVFNQIASLPYPVLLLLNVQLPFFKVVSIRKKFFLRSAMCATFRNESHKRFLRP